MTLEYLIDEKPNDIKNFLLKQGLSHRLLLTLKRNNSIFIENNKIKIDLNYEEESDNIVPTQMDLDIVYEDDSILILNKPAGIPVHPSLHYYSTSLSNGVKYYFNQKNLKKKIRPVNRLDKDTSGLVIFAKNEYVQEELIKQMKNKQFKKEYIALVVGILDEKSGTINAPIARKSDSIIERTVSPDGDIAITHYEVVKEFDGYSLVKFFLETGRTHQIRVHCMHIGHPILGDTLYGKTSSLIFRQALHAHTVEFISPLTKKHVSYSAPIPEDINFLCK